MTKNSIPDGYRTLRSVILAAILATLMCTGLFYAASARANEATTPSLEPYPVIRLDGTLIDASISKPVAAKFPILFILQGSNCASERDSLAAMAQPWRQSFGFLYIEKPGVSAASGCTPTYMSQNTIDQRMWDILRVVQKLGNEPWWNGELYVLGVSEGGLIAGLTAANVPEVQRVAILAYGGGLTMGEWWPDAAAAGVLKETGSVEASEKERAKVIETFERARKTPSTEETFHGDTNTLAWWASIIDLRLQNVLVDVNIPILVCHGENDPYAPVAGARLLKDAFAKRNKTNLEYRELRGLDHGFTDSEGRSSLEAVYTSSLKWLLDRGK